jgi:Raf kinase inhibitor-like YbhB/YbcL family protein
LTVTSSAFKANAEIPTEFTCEGSEVSPPLAWSAVPNNTRTIAIFVDDPDAPRGSFTHWLVTNLPSTTTGLLAGAALPEGAVAAKNDKGNMGYAGPCPPSGRHRYSFHVYALDTSLPHPASKADFFAAIQGHVLAQGELTGVYTTRIK